MGCYATLILLYSALSLSSCSRFPLRMYYYIDIKMTWTEAQHYCRAHFTDLATMESKDDINRLKPSFSYTWAWIGLEDNIQSWKVTMGNDSNSWKWSATGETSKTGYESWFPTAPNNVHGREACVIMYADGLWDDKPCEGQFAFVCYTATSQGEKSYVFVSTLGTWNSAQEYCRKHHTDLPMIENAAENRQVSSAISTNAAWIGLYRVPWTWSDRSQSSYKFWQRSKPNNYNGVQHCMHEFHDHGWDDENCAAKHPFVCHQVLKLKTVVKMKIQTKADMTDPAVNTQVLQQLVAVLRRRGWTAFKLQWKIQPRK